MKSKEKSQDEKETLTTDDQTQTLPFCKLLSQADQLDWLLIALGTLGSIVHGLAQPVGYFLLGKALDAYGSNIGDLNDMVHALKHVSNMLNHSWCMLKCIIL